MDTEKVKRLEPWKRKSPTILEAKPNEPTITTRRGLEISNGELNERVSRYSGRKIPGVLKKRSNASINIEKQRAKRKTPLTRAAKISARCQP
jgi:hypothetical protein